MFLNTLIKNNPALIQASIKLHQEGKLPANSYVLDLDMIEANAKLFVEEANKHNLKTFAMTKQIGRNSSFCQAIKKGGIDSCVAVDIACGVSCKRAGLKVGHLGHLVQVPKHEANLAANNLQPEYWTVYSDIKAKEAASASTSANREQKLLARIHADGDTFYRGHEGGFKADDIVDVAKMIDDLDHANFAGITTFPALLYDNDKKIIERTANLTTLEKANEKLNQAGRTNIEINAPGTTSSVVLPILAEAGVTQCEPGNGLHGTTPLHAIEDLPEKPAVVYLSEVSHIHANTGFCFGGGMYIDPVFPDYEVKAVVASEEVSNLTERLVSVEIPPPSAIDYYGMIESADKVKAEVGDSVVFGFRGQAFVTRAFVAGVSGISSGNLKVESIENCFGETSNWPNLS